MKPHSCSGMLDSCSGAWNDSVRSFLFSEAYLEVSKEMVHTRDGAIAVVYTSL